MAIKLSKGQKLDLTKNNPLLNKVLIGLGWSASSSVDLDTAAFLLRADGKVESDEDFVFYGNLRHKSGSVEHSGDKSSGGGSGDVERIHVDLGRVPADVERIDFTATIYDAQSRKQNFGMVRDAYIRVVDESSGQELLRYNLGDNFSIETAIVVGEIYRHKGQWKFNAIGSGWQGGLAALCKNFGVDVSEDDSSSRRNEPPPTPTPINTRRSDRSDRSEPKPSSPPINARRSDPSPINARRSSSKSEPPSASPSTKRSGPLNLGRSRSDQSQSDQTRSDQSRSDQSRSDQSRSDQSRSDQSRSSSPKKVELKKGQKINLKKAGSEYGEIVINLNWSQPPQRPPSGFFDRLFGSSNKGIDLDLGCLYELKDGEKGAIQALGNNFGSLQSAPYIALDGDDRTGSIAAGETIRLNGKFADKIKRILVYTFIYDGVANWRQVDGVVTVKCTGSPDIIVRMDEYGSDKSLCGIALIENTGSTFSVEKVVEFFDSQSYLDRAFNWGLRWSAGSK